VRHSVLAAIATVRVHRHVDHLLGAEEVEQLLVVKLDELERELVRRHLRGAREGGGLGAGPRTARSLSLARRRGGGSRAQRRSGCARTVGSLPNSEKRPSKRRGIRPLEV